MTGNNYFFDKFDKQKQNLTDREIEYLSLVALGYKNNTIAKVLCVSESTVKKTLENIFRKLNAKDRTHSVTIAFLNNLLDCKTINAANSKYPDK